MKGTCNLKIFSTTMIFILMISIICIVNPTSQGYEESRAPGKDYEIVLDVPWRIKKGKDIPVLLIIHDADDARSLVRPNSIGVPIREIVVSIYDSEHKLLSNQTFNATELGGPMGSAALLITDETWTKEVIFSPSDFIGKGPDYMGNAEVEAVFRC